MGEMCLVRGFTRQMLTPVFLEFSCDCADFKVGKSLQINYPDTPAFFVQRTEQFPAATNIGVSSPITPSMIYFPRVCCKVLVPMFAPERRTQC